MSEGVILAIDGGGSKTLVALADSAGRVLRLERGRGVNPLDSRDWQQALEAQLQPFAGYAELAGVTAALPAYGEVEELSAAQRETIAEAFDQVPQHVLNDVDAAHIGAFAGGPGILILSGTGSMAWARDAAGRSFRVGGWGDALGDEGSGHWIGRRVLELVTQSIDGRVGPTTLVEALFDELKVDRADPVNGLGSWVSRLTNPRSEIAALAPLATRAAETGDAGAKRIVEAAAEELVRHHKAIARLAGPPLEWSYAGGTFASRALREAVAARIGCQPRPPRLPPIGGALLKAAQLSGWPTDANWIEPLAASLQDASNTNRELQLAT
jgi:N-acetylglucosamine kinase-like BadF-type ATPase